MADFLPQHSIRMAPPATVPLACDSCGAAAWVADGKLPDGWRIVPLPSCEWPFGDFYECPRCAAESGARHHTTGAA